MNTPGVTVPICTQVQSGTSSLPIVNSASRVPALRLVSALSPTETPRCVSTPRECVMSRAMMPQMNSCLENGGETSASLRSLLCVVSGHDAATRSTESKLSTVLRAGSRSVLPSGVRLMPLPARTNSCPPSSSSSSWIDFETAWTETPSSCAATVKLPERAARQKNTSCRMFMALLR